MLWSQYLRHLAPQLSLGGHGKISEGGGVNRVEEGRRESPTHFTSLYSRTEDMMMFTRAKDRQRCSQMPEAETST